MSNVHEQSPYVPGLVAGVKAAADLPKQRFLGMDGDLCAAGAFALGVTEADTGEGLMAPYAINGILIVEAGGVVTAEGKVESDASGRAVNYTSGEILGRALTGATEAGQFIKVIRV